MMRAALASSDEKPTMAFASSDLFGTKNFGVNHNILVSNIPVGSLCFGCFSAFLYQREAAARGSAICFQATFSIWGTICVIGTLLCIVLYVRSRNFPRRLIVR